MKCKYCGKKGVQLKHYAQKHQKQLQAARRRHAGKHGGKRSKGHGGGHKSSTVGTGGYSKLTLTFHN